MKIRTSLTPALIALTIALASPDALKAQVVEDRDSEANPASVLFRSTLYGVGTGLVLGGAYALIDQGSTSEALRWGAASGAAAGLLVGLVYVATRSEPEGSANEVGMLQLADGELRFSPARMFTTHVRDMPPFPVRTLDVNLVRLGY